MSKYFLRQGSEQLTHGAEIFERCLGKEEYAELRNKKNESEYFSFQMVCESITNAFPEHDNEIIRGLVEMLTFDALIGHNDRHPYNWGVIVPVRKKGKPRFSPVYDTARALFWQNKELYFAEALKVNSVKLQKYIRHCIVPFGWDTETKVDFFRLIGLIWNSYECYRPNIEKFLTNEPLQKSIECVDKEFGLLFSRNRRELIKKCLCRRQELLNEVVSKFREGEKENAS